MKLQALDGPEGARDVVLLLHGFGADRLSWTGTARALAEHAQVLAADLPAHGSAASEGVDSFEQLVENAETSLAGCAPWRTAERRHLVGHSLGGGLALALAARRAADEDAVTLASLSLIAPLGLGRHIDREWLHALVALEEPHEARAHLVRLVGNPKLIPPRLGATLIAHLGRSGVRERLGALAVAIEAAGPALESLVDVLARSELPRTVIWGEEDGFGPYDSEALERFGGERLLLDGCGHLPHIERRTAVNRALVAALRRESGTEIPTGSS